jgi:hypothetical protein
MVSALAKATSARNRFVLANGNAASAGLKKVGFLRIQKKN